MLNQSKHKDQDQINNELEGINVVTKVTSAMSLYQICKTFTPDHNWDPETQTHVLHRARGFTLAVNAIRHNIHIPEAPGIGPNLRTQEIKALRKWANKNMQETDSALARELLRKQAETKAHADAIRAAALAAFAKGKAEEF